MREHRDAIEKAYSWFVRNIEKQNNAIEQKVEHRNQLRATHKPGDMMT